MQPDAKATNSTQAKKRVTGGLDLETFIIPPWVSEQRTAPERAGRHLAAIATPVIHRDIRPKNILLSGREAVVADFGVHLFLP